MSVKQNLTAILSELTDNSRYLDDAQLDDLVCAIREARRIFTAGAGRSGIAIRGFANRLMHLGLAVSSVGEITCPHTEPGDLLIIGSGSGETESLVAMADRAKKNGVRIALITMDKDSAIGRMADCVVALPGVSPKLKHAGRGIISCQPMGSAFEQISFLTYDAVIMELMERMDETSDTMFCRHADLE